VCLGANKGMIIMMMNTAPSLAKKSARKIFNNFPSGIKWQSLLEKIHVVVLHGMNIGTGGNYKKSGEINALRYISSKYSDMNAITIFDVGANIGGYSNMVYNLLQDKAKIYAFEPSRVTYRKLVENTRNIKDIECINFGLGNEATQTILYSNAEASGLASMHKRNLEHFNIELDKKETINIQTLDSFCEEKNIRQIHFLKLDVEGNELNVLKGAQQKIVSGGIDYIQFEFGGCNIDSRTYFQDFYYLLKNRYRFYRILKNGLFELKKYKETYECFITTNFLLENLNLRS
jgi:FkbM family methyltransferase